MLLENKNAGIYGGGGSVAREGARGFLASSTLAA